MTITTAQERALVSECCGCALPSCADPRIECESITGTASLDGYAPFAEPTGAATDPIAEIYETLDTEGPTTLYDGTAGFYYCGSPNIGGWGESTWTNSATATSTDGGDWQWIDPDCIAIGQSSGAVPTSGWELIDENTCERTATTLTKADEVWEAIFGTKKTLECPGPWDVDDVEWADIVRKDGATKLTLSGAKTQSGIISDAIADIGETWPSPAEGNECSASSSVTWPTISDFYEGSPGAWPACDSESMPLAASAEAAATRARYRFGVPADYSTTELPRSTWEMQWDEVFFPDDTEIAPSLVASRDWTWGGSMESPWSEWFTLEPPTEPGEVRVVNVMVKCWKSTRLGVVPTSYGETVTIA